jgi:hypothetical protein
MKFERSTSNLTARGFLLPPALPRPWRPPPHPIPAAYSRGRLAEWVTRGDGRPEAVSSLRIFVWGMKSFALSSVGASSESDGRGPRRAALFCLGPAPPVLLAVRGGFLEKADFFAGIFLRRQGSTHAASSGRVRPSPPGPRQPCFAGPPPLLRLPSRGTSPPPSPALGLPCVRRASESPTPPLGTSSSMAAKLKDSTK